MLARRIIPCLDVKDGVVVKGVQFRNHEVMGDIVPLAKRYAEEGADDAACRQGALHDAQADAQFLRRCIDGHDGQFHRPQARREALEHAHERQLQRRRDDAAEKIADR